MCCFVLNPCVSGVVDCLCVFVCLLACDCVCVVWVCYRFVGLRVYVTASLFGGVFICLVSLICVVD